MCNRSLIVAVSCCAVLVATLSSGTAEAYDIQGSGTAGRISKFTDGGTIGDSALFESGGSIGLGTTTPSTMFHVNSGAANSGVLFESTDPAVLINLKDNTTTGYGYAIMRAGDQLDFMTEDSTKMRITADGRVGIGTTQPASVKLHVNSGTTNMATLYESTDPTVVFCLKDDTTTGNGWALMRTGDLLDLITGDTARVRIDASGNVGVGTTAPSEKLTVRGNVLIERSNGTAVLELGDGLDYAEGFDVTEADKPEPGTVLVIDASNPGQLTLSTEAYDTKVVGIVAGANNLGSGVRLGVNDFDCDVSLAGRVYCNVDATECAIEPGDLLTTSSVPGYAMKAVDREQRAGAVLGKAMQGLEKGQKGQILVFVTIQ